MKMRVMKMRVGVCEGTSKVEMGMDGSKMVGGGRSVVMGCHGSLQKIKVQISS